MPKELRLLCKDKPTEWASHLLWAEYALNACRNLVTNHSPFQRVLGYDPQLFPWDSDPGNVPRVEEWFQTAQEVWRQTQRVLNAQSAWTKVQADRHRRNAASYRVGQRVWLSTRNLKLPTCRKLSARFIGPFKILQCKGPTSFRLQLPRVYRISLTFHASLLKQ